MSKDIKNSLKFHHVHANWYRFFFRLNDSNVDDGLTDNGIQ